MIAWDSFLSVFVFNLINFNNVRYEAYKNMCNMYANEHSITVRV